MTAALGHTLGMNVSSAKLLPPLRYIQTWCQIAMVNVTIASWMVGLSAKRLQASRDANPRSTCIGSAPLTMCEATCTMNEVKVDVLASRYCYI